MNTARRNTVNSTLTLLTALLLLPLAALHAAETVSLAGIRREMLAYAEALQVPGKPLGSYFDKPGKTNAPSLYASCDVVHMRTVMGEDLQKTLTSTQREAWIAHINFFARSDGTCRIIPAAEVVATDKVLPNELRPCTVTVQDNGIYEFRETTEPTNFSVYYRGDPRENEATLREALPALYLSFQSNTSKN